MATNSLSKKVEKFPILFDDFFRPWNELLRPREGWGTSNTIPSVNISETKDFYLVSMAIPGMKKTDFKIGIEGNMLTISSEMEETKEEKEEEYTRKEYNYSTFSRSFNLPDEINKEKIEAIYSDGILKLTLPKKEEAKKLVTSKQITVK